MLYFPANQQYLITDGTAAPGAHGSIANPRNFSPFWRSGGDISVADATEKRGNAGRVADEYIYLQRYAVSISDLVTELEDIAQTGTTVLFVPGNVRYGQERIYQRQLASGDTLTVNALVTMVGNTVEEAGVVKRPVSLQATGALTVVGF